MIYLSLPRVEREYLTWYDEDGNVVSQVHAHLRDREPYRRERKIAFWVIVGVLIGVAVLTHPHTWHGYEYYLGRILLYCAGLYLVGYAAYSAWDWIAWRFQWAGRCYDSARQRWIID